MGVRHQTGGIIQALGLVHAKMHVEQRFVIERLHAHNAQVALEHLAHVAAEPHGLPVAQLGDGQLLQFFAGRFRYFTLRPPTTLPRYCNRVCLPIGLVRRGRIDDGNVIVHRVAHNTSSTNLSGVMFSSR